MIKKYTIYCLLFVVSVLAAAEKMGQHDPDSNCFLVKGKGYSFQFFEGHMFPQRFTLNGVGEMPYCKNIDALRCKGQLYHLHLDRWTKMSIITNTPKEFTVEFEGKFWRNGRPWASAVEKVKAIYRYTFLYNVPGFKVSGRLIKSPDCKEELRIVQTLAFAWQENFVDKVKHSGGQFAEVRLNRHYDIKKDSLTFSGKKFTVTLKSPRVIGIVNPDNWRSKVMMNGGLWGVDWKSPEIKFEAQLYLGAK